MPIPPDLTALPLGARVQDPLVVVDVAVRHAEEAPFTVLTLGNAHGTIDSAPFWLGDQPKIAGITRGTVVQVIGEVTTFRDRRQLNVTSIRVLPRDSVEWGLLVPGVGDQAPWWDALDKWRGDVGAPRLRAVLDLFYEDVEFRDRFSATPGSLSGIHARRGGLLKLTAEVVAAGRPLARMAGGDLDLVLAGGLLHGIGCTVCFTSAWPFGLTEIGALSSPGHAGARLLEARIQGITPPPVDHRELLILQHMVIAAGERASAAPLLVEAEVVRLAVAASRDIGELADAARRATPVPPLAGEAELRRSGQQLFWGSMPDWGRS